MPFAIVQHNLDPLPPERLERAFRSVPQLTTADAKLLARDGFGIIVNNLTFEAAATLQHALDQQGIATDVVDQLDLPKLPPAKRLKRADCLPEALVLYDALGRPTPRPWSQVRLIAAALAPRLETDRMEAICHIRIHGVSVPITEYYHKSQEHLRLMLEIYVHAMPPRYMIIADQFQYTYLGDRLARTALENFLLLLRDLLQYATSARANRGAEALVADPPRAFSYPTLHAFEEETVWILWQARQSRRQGD